MNEECTAKIVILDTETNVQMELYCIDVVVAVALKLLLKQTNSYKNNEQYQFTIETV